MNSKILCFPFYLLIFMSFPALFGCGLLEKQPVVPSFPKKIRAKKTKQKEAQTWQDIQNQKNKSFSQRIKDIEAFIQANKSKEIALDGYLLKANLFLKNKKAKQACLSYHQVVQSSFDYTRRWEAYRASAQCYFKEGKIKPAVETLERLIQNPKETVQNKKASAQLQWTFLKSKNLKGKKAWVPWKLINLSHLFALSSHSQEKKSWQDKGKHLIQSLSYDDLIRCAKQARRFGVFAAYVLYQAGEYFFENKELSQARHYFKKSLSASLSLNLKKEAKNRLTLIKQIFKVNPYLIGVLVPLSGRRKALGEKILRGLYMGLDMEKDSSWQIVVMDSKSHPDVVRTQLDNLFYKYHVIGLVGGLTSETAEVIAEKAQTLATPAILFSQKNGLSSNRDFVFQNSVTADQLLKPLAKQARRKLKINTIALLYPDDPYGKEYASLFSEMFKQAGGKITGYEIYKTGEVDFKKPVRSLLHLNIKGREREFEKLKQKFLKENPVASGRSQKLTPENLLPVKKEFAAVFIPDSLDQIRKIKDHLKYFGIKDIYLLGTDLWRPGSLSSWSEDDLPLVFVNLPEQDKPLVQKSSFYKEYVKSYAHPPGLFEQRAYNAALFLKQALSQEGVRSRLSLQKELKKLRVFQGAYYKISISKDRIFHYPLNVYKTDHRTIRVLDSMPVK